MTTRPYGILLVATSAFLWSTAGLFVRMADLDVWTILGWRSVFSAVTLGAFALARHRRDFGAAVLRNGRPGVISTMISVISAFAYVVALKLTTVANVMTIYAALPFVTAGVAYLWHGERINRSFAIAASFTVLGIAIMAGASAAANDLAGIGAAAITTSGFATQLVYTKRHSSIDMTIVSAAAALCTGLLAWPFMQAATPAPSQLLACALLGIFSVGFAYILVVNGGRHIASGEAAFISLLDVVLGPLWVWIFFSETPRTAALLGGLVVLGSVSWYLLRSAAKNALVPG